MVMLAPAGTSSPCSARAALGLLDSLAAKASFDQAAVSTLVYALTNAARSLGSMTGVSFL
jgi:hypothetical protein